MDWVNTHLQQVAPGRVLGPWRNRGQHVRQWRENGPLGRQRHHGEEAPQGRDASHGHIEGESRSRELALCGRVHPVSGSPQRVACRVPRATLARYHDIRRSPPTFQGGWHLISFLRKSKGRGNPSHLISHSLLSHNIQEWIRLACCRTSWAHCRCGSPARRSRSPGAPTASLPCRPSPPGLHPATWSRCVCHHPPPTAPTGCVLF